MRTVTRIPEVREAVAAARAGGRRVGFVPTMGYLHEGHLRLVDEAKRRAEYVVMSVFVNPLQFAPTEDLARYPRDLAGDSTKADARGVDLLFAPAAAEMYPGERRVAVVPVALHERWEGAIRPGHFAGVLTVVAKLFNIVQPDVAVFGQKDFQQATLVRAMVRDLNIPLELVVAPIVREADGLAMSSRNSYLSAAERTRARALSRALAAVREAYAGGERNAPRLVALGERVIHAVDGVKLDYFALVHPETLDPVLDASDGTAVLVAARVGGTRLIDNTILAAADDALTAAAVDPVAP
jgi:pantoate--beta-alanine ligase